MEAWEAFRESPPSPFQLPPVPEDAKEVLEPAGPVEPDGGFVALIDIQLGGADVPLSAAAQGCGEECAAEAAPPMGREDTEGADVANAEAAPADLSLDETHPAEADDPRLAGRDHNVRRLKAGLADHRGDVLGAGSPHAPMLGEGLIHYAGIGGLIVTGAKAAQAVSGGQCEGRDLHGLEPHSVPDPHHPKARGLAEGDGGSLILADADVEQTGPGEAGIPGDALEEPSADAASPPGRVYNPVDLTDLGALEVGAIDIAHDGPCRLGDQAVLQNEPGPAPALQQGDGIADAAPVVDRFRCPV